MSSMCWCCCRCCFCIIHYFFFLRLFHQRCLSTSLSNSTECFCVPWSWTDHLPRRNKRHRKQSQWPLLLSIEWVYSLHRKYLVERSTLRSIRKLFLFTGCLCYNSGSDAGFIYKYLWYDPTQYSPFSCSYLLTTNFGRSSCLGGCWSILI